MKKESIVPYFEQIRIENTNRCGYKCVMCPRDKHKRQQGIMPIEDFNLALDRVGSFKGELHLHGFGEALLDKGLPKKVRIAKKRMPKAVVGNYTTLGVPFKENYFFDLVDSGIDVILVSCYGYTPETYRAIHGTDAFHIVKRNLEIISKARLFIDSSLKLEIIPAGDKMLITLGADKDRRTEFKEWIESLGFSFTPERRLHNYGDGRTYNKPEDRLCPVVKDMRRAILQITWDLKVIPCCYDYDATIPFGDLRTQTLEDIFSSPAYKDFIKAHLSNNLENYPICQNCEKDIY
ncbi:MAG: radical SAM/SPASM domain-containing protein [Chlamydiota bacterium]